uniref:Uncharacterized protein n=1 Tax=Daphnia magna TaxID=35525 RepID=A0A0P4WZG2_9CRUS
MLKRPKNGQFYIILGGYCSLNNKKFIQNRIGYLIPCWAGHNKFPALEDRK